jgi:hypothetical protein
MIEVAKYLGEEEEDEVDEGDDEEEELQVETPYSIKAMCYKTVEVFAGIVERKLWLKDAGAGMPCTDGYLIHVPFAHPRSYQYTEHEISHVLFKSDGLARMQFIQDYAAKVVSVAPSVANGERTLRKAMTDITGILDDERVISLWGLLYGGSEAIMRRMKHQESEPHLEDAHDDLLTLFYCLAGGHETPPGRLDRYKPYMLEALRKVRYRDYLGVLVAAKWLINMLVGEMIREAKKQPPPVGPKWTISNLIGAQGTSPGMSPSSTPEPAKDSAPRETGQVVPEAPGAAQKGSSPTPKVEEWRPPKVEAPVAEREKALKSLLGDLGVAPKPKKNTPQFDIDDVQPSKFKNVQDRAFATRVVNAALNADMKDPDVMEKALSASAAHMQQIVDKARQATRNVVNEDDRIRQDALAKVVFHDESLAPLANTHVEIPEEDRHTTQRLRAGFVRVMGRRVNTLDDSGTTIDIPAVIERSMTMEAIPVFRSDGKGRGFKALILIDRSSSMEGARTQQAERGCRIISRALKFPFVHSAVWGFQSWEDGQVDITRFAPGMETFTTDSSRVGGKTPLHTAIRVAVRHLEAGTERKQLFVISDGFPCYARKGGDRFATKTLMGFVRGEVQRARSHGIGVTGVMIGRDVKPDGMSFMFGSEKHWRVLGQAFGNDLVHLVTRSFIDYLRSG